MRTNYNDSSQSSGRSGSHASDKYAKRQSSPASRRYTGRRTKSYYGDNVSSLAVARNKYIDLAREAIANGQRVDAENFYQHAEHYIKMISAASSRRYRDDYGYDDYEFDNKYSYKDEVTNNNSQESNNGPANIANNETTQV